MSGADGFAESGRARRYVSATASAAETPTSPPTIPTGMIDVITGLLNQQEAPFLRHLASSVALEWLPADSDCLGNTRFEMATHEVEIRKRTRMPPGEITISLHPVLIEDQALYAHTLAHELLHAAGLTDHSSRHTELVTEIAPAPTLADSPLLTRIREEALSQQEVKDWNCTHCGFVWSRDTVRAPARCPKCARPFK